MKGVLLVTFFFVAMTIAMPPSKECRGEQKPKVRPSDCCTESNLINEAALADCASQYPDSSEESGDSTRHRPGHHPCVMECYFNKTGIFKDGEPVKTVALDVLSKSADASITALLNAGIDTCIAHQAEIKQKMKKGPMNGQFPPPPPHGDGGDKKRCPPDSKFFLRCVEHHVYKNCPADKLVSSADCTQLKDFTAKCFPN